MRCQEHKFKHTPIILHQRYCNHKDKRVEVLLEVQGDKCFTSHYPKGVHLDYFRDVYTLSNKT